MHLLVTVQNDKYIFLNFRKVAKNDVNTTYTHNESTFLLVLQWFLINLSHALIHNFNLFVRN